MAVVARHPLSVLRRFLPLATAVVAVLVDLMPLPSAAPLAVAPLTTLCVLFFWSVYQPKLLGPPSIFGVCLFLDAAAGLPLGLTALAALLARALLGGRHVLLQAYGFPVLWGCFMLAAAAVLSLRWALACLSWWHLFAFEPILVEILLTVAAYPLISWLLGGMQPWLRGRRHASGS
ncbi:MAG: hypothetical protein KDG89_00350 [Geminicoccaceae bacterium]|nr:hypothetical protein [Geminicoccaceae bacterium]